MLKLKTKQDVENFTHGCCFFGTGGGGNSSFGQKMLMDALDAGKKIQIVPRDSLDPQDWIVCPYLMGTSGPETEEKKAAKLKYGLRSETVLNMPAAATKLLLKQAEKPTQLSAIIPYEIGAAATASAVATAAWLDIPVLDADFVGRSVPEATQMLPALYGMDLCPIASSDAFGNETMIYQAVNRYMIERIGKYTASASFGLIGQAVLLRQIRQLKNHMITGSLSRALAVGNLLSAHQKKPEATEFELNQLIGAKKIFEGIISKFIGYEEEGYYVGEIIIQGKNKDAELKIWFKNENHIAWLNGQVFITSPELITLVDTLSYLPYVNNQLREGLQVTAYGTPCDEAWYKEEIIKANCPRYYGFDFDPVFLT